MIEQEKDLDLATLKYLMVMGSMFSDITTKSMLYKRLCEMVEKREKEDMGFNNRDAFGENK